MLYAQLMMNKSGRGKMQSVHAGSDLFGRHWVYLIKGYHHHKHLKIFWHGEDNSAGDSERSKKERKTEEMGR